MSKKSMVTFLSVLLIKPVDLLADSLSPPHLDALAERWRKFFKERCANTVCAASGKSHDIGLSSYPVAIHHSRKQDRRTRTSLSPVGASRDTVRRARASPHRRVCSRPTA
jgi:hypothetical protein